MKQVPFRLWGAVERLGLDPAFGSALAQDYESGIDAVTRSLERRTGLKCCAGPCDEGSVQERGVVVAKHYALTLGRPLRSGGYTPEGKLWISIPSEV